MNDGISGNRRIAEMIVNYQRASSQRGSIPSESQCVESFRRLPYQPSKDGSQRSKSDERKADMVNGGDIRMYDAHVPLSGS